MPAHERRAEPLLARHPPELYRNPAPKDKDVVNRLVVCCEDLGAVPQDVLLPLYIHLSAAAPTAPSAPGAHAEVLEATGLREERADDREGAPEHGAEHSPCPGDDRE